MWPFEQRAAGRRYPDSDNQDPDENGGYAEMAVEAALRLADGSSVDAGALGLVSAAIRLWEHSIASATVEPMNNRLQGLTPELLALAGRALAVSGNAIFAIRVDGARVALLPVSSYDIHGNDPEPRSWLYRVDLLSPSSGSQTLLLPSASVLHFRCGASMASPWHGVAPLAQSRATARLAALIEASFTKEAAIPVGRVGLANGQKQASNFLKWLKTGGFLVAGETASRGLQPEPAARHKPQTLGPDPSVVMEALRSSSGRDILSSFGIPPSLFEARTDGTGAREALRRFVYTIIAPLLRGIQAEVREKLDTAAELTLDELRAADVDARSRAMLRKAQAAKVLHDLGVGMAEAMAKVDL